MATMTIYGLNRYVSAGGGDLWKDLTLPDGIDRETLIDNILLKSGSFEVLYPDPDFLSYMIGVWSRKHQRTFEKWVKALAIDYDPLYNYDRTEEWTDDSTGSGSSTSKTQSGTERKTSAYNSSTYQPDNQDQMTGDSISTDTGSTHGVHKGRMYGNIGVTTSQQMLQAELDIARFNLIDQITDLFLEEFVIPVY